MIETRGAGRTRLSGPFSGDFCLPRKPGAVELGNQTLAGRAGVT
jgi:hypothetical protein